MAKPEVDRLERELNNHYSVIRINISSDVGKYVRHKYSADMVPTFVVFDDDGREIWRQSGNVPKSTTVLSLKR